MDWIASFLDRTKHITSPELFRKWSAIYILAAAMERKTWIRTSSGAIYPNLFIVLVGPPGVGKTEVTWRARSYLQSLGDHHIAPASVTKASLIDSLNSAGRHIIRPHETPSAVVFNSLAIISNELGVLLPGYDTEFMNTLTDIYDCKGYSETRRTKELKIEIKNPQLSILAACTPSYLQSMLPEGAWDQGFTSRTFLIYSGERILKPLFEFISTESGKTDKDLEERAKAYGEFRFTEEAAKLIEEWHMSGGQPVPDHPKLFHYCSRRTVHALKLCMVASISEGTELVVTQDHVMRALDWMVEAEVHMEDIFREMASSSHGELLNEVWHFIFKAYNKAGKKAVHEHRVRNFIAQRTAAHNVERVLEVMVKAGLLERNMISGYVGFVPKAKED